MKKLILFVVILVVILAGVFAFMRYKTALAPAAPIQETQTITIEDKKITENTTAYTVAITYPYIEGQAGFNKKVEGVVQEELTAFKKNSVENPTAPYDLEISYTKGQVDETIASVVLTISSYQGGAHGNTYFIAVNYDLKNNKEITLADAFAGQKDYLKNISDYSIKDLTKQIKDRLGEVDAAWVAEGAGPNQDNFSALLLKQYSITFYFAPYQVAAYAAGDFQVSMPR